MADGFPIPDALPTTAGLSANGTARPIEEGPDPFDPATIRLAQNFDTALGVKKVLLTVPIRKPAREWFIRTHPDDNYSVLTSVIELKEAGEIYLVAPHLREALQGDSTFAYRHLCTTINRQGTIFFWPIRVPSTEGRIDNWSKSALEAAQMARHQWVRVQADMSLGAYTVCCAEHTIEPPWPEISMRDLICLAFKEHHITTLDHPVLRQLRGEG